MTATSTPAEAGWDTAPSLVDGAMTLTLTPADCTLDYWIPAVAQGTLAGLVRGHHPDAETPAYMLDAAGIDEIRHLTVGSSIVRQHLIDHPQDRGRLEELVGRGRQLWATVPVVEMLGRRERCSRPGSRYMRNRPGTTRSGRDGA